MISDARSLLGQAAMSRAQIAAVAVTVGLNALDGFDVQSISFAAPGIAHDWGIDRKALGIVLSMELVGMSIGSVLIGGLADRVGRRRTILGCLVIMSLGMLMVTTTTSLAYLCAWRLFTGLGIGGMLAATNAAATELASERRRDLCVALMASGYPVGAVIGGAVTAVLLRTADWHAVFLFGALATAAFLPLVYYAVPESVGWLCERQPPNALGAINRTLARFGHAPISALPPRAPAARGASLRALFAPGLATVTMLVTIAYFLHIVSFYYLLKWIPTLVVGMGYAPAAAASVLVWANVGGATGGAVFGIAAHRVRARLLTIAVLVLSTGMIALFGHGQRTLAGLSVVCAVTGFCTNGGVVGLYAILARAFPTALRATGTGFVIGVGRGGAALAPMLAGYLFHQGFGLQTVSIVMGGGSLLGAGVLACLRLADHAAHPSAQRARQSGDG